MTENVNKVLVVGWDGAGWDYLDPLINSGQMPNLSALLGRGARFTLHSTLPPSTNIAWPSLVTGLTPASTGVMDASFRHPVTGRIGPTNARGFRGVPIWRWANRHGRTAAVMNVPMTFPAGPIDGYMVTGFDSPRTDRRICFPRSILKVWAGQGHAYRILAEETRLMDRQHPRLRRGQLETFVDNWEALTREQGDMAAWLLRAWPADLMWLVFSGSDSINHRTWQVDQVARVYLALDAALGRLLAQAEETTLVCLVSDHGSTQARRYLSLNRALYDAGWIQFRPQVASRYVRRLLGQAGAARWAGLPERLRRLISWPLLSLDPRLRVAADNVDRQATRVYTLSGLGTLYLEQGRHNSAEAPASEDHPSLIEQVREHFLRLRDPAGKRLFREVWRGTTLFPGARGVDAAPDLVLEVADWRDHLIGGHPQDPLVRLIPPEEEYGTHTPEGILVLAGPGIRPGEDLGGAQLWDVVPTLLAGWGLPLPAKIEGLVLQRAFAQRVEISRQDEDSSAAYRQGSTDQQGMEEVIDRLRSLGYIE